MILHTQILNRHIDVVYHFDGNYVASSHEAEEIKQEVVIDAIYFFGKDIYPALIRYDRLFNKDMVGVVYNRIE